MIKIKSKKKLINLINKIVEENFWKDKILAQKILKEKKFFDNILSDFNFTINELENIEQLIRTCFKRK